METLVGILICVTAIVSFVVVVLYVLRSDQRKFDETKKAAKELYVGAKSRYKDSLELLKKRPTDPELRLSALKLGREFANLTRSFDGVTVFDEIALMNDINAACASGALTVSSATSTGSISQRLDKLAELLELQQITDEEYASRRQKILEEI